MKKLPKAKKGAWFVKIRGSYLPGAWQGWLLYLPFLVFLTAVLLVAFKDGVNFASVFFNVFPAWIAAAVVLTFIASRKS